MTLLRRLFPWACTCGSLSLLMTITALAQVPASIHRQLFSCNESEGIFCSEQFDIPSYEYVGHDEPSLLFYSSQPGSGYTNLWHLKLPKDSPIPPKQDGTGGTWNFQLHPAFWFGMAMCDSQSYPEYTNVCSPGTDENIYDSPDPYSPRYIGKHPGTAYMEMQFYPPGWVTSDTATKWTAGLNIDSLSKNAAGQGNNAACGGAIEYVNFAFIQRDGIPSGSPSPLGPFVRVNDQTLLLNPGDDLIVTVIDTEQGLKVIVQDLTTDQTGFMVASSANGFAQILYDPDGTNCDFSTHNLPYDFHPMYATSSEHTRVPWAAHSSNIAFSDEIGHFEYCSSVDQEGGNCTSNKGGDKSGIDDAFCIDPAFSASFGLLPIGGCIDADVDFDGVSYRSDTWPGSLTNPIADFLVHGQPVTFSSPLFFTPSGATRNYSRVAFETDLPRIETNTNPHCQRFITNPSDPAPGQGCINPPKGADFYPIYTTRVSEDGCQWQLGGANLPFILENFGGTSTAEYGSLLPLLYPGTDGQPSFRYNDFRNILDNNPCPAGRF